MFTGHAMCYHVWSFVGTAASGFEIFKMCSYERDSYSPMPPSELSGWWQQSAAEWGWGMQQVDPTQKKEKLKAGRGALSSNHWTWFLFVWFCSSSLPDSVFCLILEVLAHEVWGTGIFAHFHKGGNEFVGWNGTLSAISAAPSLS